MKLAYVYMVRQKLGHAPTLEFAVQADSGVSESAVDLTARKIVEKLGGKVYADERIHYVRIIPLFNEQGEVVS